MKLCDLAGKRFGNLTAVNECGRDKQGRALWYALCDCGGSGVFKSGNLRSGNSKSCGCGKRKPHRRENLAGRKFGRLLVVSFDSTHKGRAMWLCACACGGNHVASAINLKKGHVRSCGCLPRYDQSNLGLATWAKLIKEGQECCAKCGATDSLHAHHIYSAAGRPEMSRDLSNGICLCRDCHVDFHSAYGIGVNGPKEICEFLEKPELEDFMRHFVGWKHHNGIRDLYAARHVVDMLISHEEGKAND